MRICMYTVLYCLNANACNYICMPCMVSEPKGLSLQAHFLSTAL